jgi:pimeloyl-ACP methyl ester carboxylesterase
VPPSDEVRGWSRLIAAVADQVIAVTAQDLHRAINRSAFRWLGPLGRPIESVNDAVVERAYGAVRAGLRGAGEVAALSADHLGSDADPPSAAAVKARAIAHGVVGDELIALAPELDLEVTLRAGDREVDLEAASLCAAYPDAGGELVVFVHGLVDSDRVWLARAADEVSLPDVAAGTGATSLLIRYGSGRAIGRNGADLAELLEALVDGWPVPVTRLTIVGHSMGGLLARAACASAQAHGHRWIRALTDIVYLGTPHLGSWLEKFANVTSWTLRHASPHSAPFGRLLDGRSRGIKDLRYGALSEDAWGTTPVDDLLSGRFPDGPWLDTVTHHLIVGRLRSSARHPLNTLFGDALVSAHSAAGTGRRRRIAGDAPIVVIEVEARHTALMRHPEVGSVLEALAS